MEIQMNIPLDPGYYMAEELRSFGFSHVGQNVRIAKNCTVIGAQNISLGDHVRIDGYTTLLATGKITIGSYVHIAAYCMLSGGDGIVMEDFSGLSHGVKIYSRTDDYSGEHLTNPTVPVEYLGVVAGNVTLGRHVIIGSGTVVLPGVQISEGVSIGAQSLVKSDLDAWGIYAGCPVRRIRGRSKNLLKLEEQLKNKTCD
jgi:acetyltransferase-like isoleucine patch superfamily enzyme